MYRIITLLLLFVLAFKDLYAQDAQYTQFYAAPLYLNPAFSGAKVSDFLIIYEQNKKIIIYRNLQEKIVLIMNSGEK